MTTVKLVSMSVRPFQVTHLCFATGGILATLDTELGVTAPAFDFGAFQDQLRGFPGDPNGFPSDDDDNSLLKFGFWQIQTQVQQYQLASLRSEPLKASLIKAMCNRQSTYYAKFADPVGLEYYIDKLCSSDTPGSKYNRLKALAVLSQEQADLLAQAYAQDARTGVIKNTTSALASTTTSSERSDHGGQSVSETVTANVESGLLEPLPGLGAMAGSLGFSSGDAMSQNFGASTSSDTTANRGDASETQSVVNTDYGYRIPYIESQAQNERAQISLLEQQFQLYLTAVTFPNLTRIIWNGQKAMDADVFQLQIAFLGTFLMSPIPGVVTAIYKNPGDAVSAGEPVVRVENNQTILLVATLVYRDRIALGATVKVNTRLFDTSDMHQTVTGQVVAARGMESDDHWDVIVKCGNLDANGNLIFPLGYRFDYDDTTIEIS